VGLAVAVLAAQQHVLLDHSLQNLQHQCRVLCSGGRCFADVAWLRVRLCIALHSSAAAAAAAAAPLSWLQAKTSIPGLGKPITAVDVTYDGAWVLATTADYLMVVKASFSDEDGEY
jgi:hypothetical protein